MRNGIFARRYLVTGGTGFIGANLVRRLVTLGAYVTVVDNNLRGKQTRLSDVQSRIELINGDVRDANTMIEASRDCDSIVHLAALNGTENFYKRPELVLDIGIQGMHAALLAARVHGIKEFILASSSEVYQTALRVPTSEDVALTIPDPWNPRYSYGGSKLASEIMLANYNGDLFERAIIFRPHNVYGPDMGEEHVIPQFARRAAALCAEKAAGKIDFPIQGDGKQTRSFVFVDDFIDGLVTILLRGSHREIYHIGTTEEVEISHLAELVIGEFGREANIIPGECPGGSTHRRCPDISKLCALGYAPKTKLKYGIFMTVTWYRENSVP